MKVYLNYWSDVLLSSSQECFTQVISPVANTQGAVILGLQMSHPDPDRFHWVCQCMKNTVTKCWCAGKKDLKTFVWSSRWFCDFCWLYTLSQTCVLSWCFIVNLKKEKKYKFVLNTLTINRYSLQWFYKNVEKTDINLAQHQVQLLLKQESKKMIKDKNDIT